MNEKYYIASKVIGSNHSGMMRYGRALAAIARIEEQDATVEELAMYNELIKKHDIESASALRRKWASRCAFEMISVRDHKAKWAKQVVA